jgi:peptidoglycan/xylan/chitin deacetylase (PgdA/CDA1 family)
MMKAENEKLYEVNRMRKRVSVLISALTAGLTAIGCGMLTQDSGTINAAERDKKLIALTFDDGPNTTTTNDVLDLLAEYDAKASFFLIGDNINSASAASVRRAYDMGMEIDNHSKTHANMSKMTAKCVISFIIAL